MLYYLEFKNYHLGANIGLIILCGYEDSSFSVFLHPVNRISEVIVAKNLASYPKPLGMNTALSSQISKKILCTEDLNACLAFVSTMDTLEDECKQEIIEHYDYFKNVMADEALKCNDEKKAALKIFSNNKLKYHKKTAAEIKRGCWEIYNQYLAAADKITKREQRKHTTEQDALFSAIKLREIAKIQPLLIQGVDPALKAYLGQPPILFCVWKYIGEKDINIKKEWYEIAKLLLDAGASPDEEHEHFDGQVALSVASECGATELVELLLKYTKKIGFDVRVERSSGDIPYVYPEVLPPLKKRVAFFKEFEKKQPLLAPITIQLSKPDLSSKSILDMSVRREDKNIQVELMLTIHLSPTDINKLFKLYEINFTPKTTHGSEENQHHFREKFGLDTPEVATYIDLIKVDSEIVGLNLYKIYNGEFHDKQYQVVYCSLAYLDKEYRGTRMMSLLSFRMPHALKLAHPETEIYIFYDAIHPSSYRQAYDIRPRYPEVRTDKSLDFINRITTQIYGIEKASEYNGVSSFFWPTSSRVQGNTIRAEEYDLPCVIENFNDITKGNGGVPVCWAVMQTTYDQLKKLVDDALGHPIFDAHIRQMVEIIFNRTPALEMGGGTECLWPDDQPVRDRALKSS